MDYKIWKIIEKIKSRKTKFDINCLEKINDVLVEKQKVKLKTLITSEEIFFLICKDMNDKQDRNSILKSKTSKDNQIRKRL